MTDPERARLARFATFLLLAAEFMLLAGLLGAIIVLRGGATAWADIGVRLHFLTFLRPQLAAFACVLLAALIWARAKSGIGVVLVATTTLQLLALFSQLRQWAHLHQAGIGWHTPEPFPLAYYTLSAFLLLHLLTGILVALAAVLLGGGTLSPIFRKNLSLFANFGAALAALLVILHLLLLF